MDISILLYRSRTSVVYVDSLEEISPDRLTELELLYNPERVLIEWNGMWNQEDLKLPVDWTIYQQITIVDMSTFDLYVKNMKSLLSAMVRNSELVICNRCDGIEDLERYKRMLMSMNTKCEIVFEDENGEIDEISEEDLPYDLNAPVVKISPEAYGIWYIDCMDKPERYVGKVVEFTAMVLKSPEFPVFVFQHIFYFWQIRPILIQTVLLLQCQVNYKLLKFLHPLHFHFQILYFPL